MKEDILEKRKSVIPSKEMDQQAKEVENTMDERLGRKVLRYNPQTKIHALCNIAMNLHTFSKYSSILHFAIKTS